jgi:hypothetical protein
MSTDKIDKRMPLTHAVKCRKVKKVKELSNPPTDDSTMLKRHRKTKSILLRQRPITNVSLISNSPYCNIIFVSHIWMNRRVVITSVS